MGTSKRYHGVKEQVSAEVLAQYASVMQNMKQQAEDMMGTKFGPIGTNGHLSSHECGRVGGAMTKGVFLSIAGASMDSGISATPPSTNPAGPTAHRLQ